MKNNDAQLSNTDQLSSVSKLAVSLKYTYLSVWLVGE